MSVHIKSTSKYKSVTPAIVTTMTARILAIREIASKNIAKYVSLLKVSGVASLYY